MTGAEYHQQQLEQQESEQVKQADFDRIAYQCLGAAQSLRDILKMRPTGYRCETIEKRLCELANTYDNLRRKYNDQNRFGA